MNGYEFKESDWKLFRKRMPDWQENYMDKLNKEYISLLSEDRNASDKFWELADRIKEDQKDTGVVVQMSRSKMLYHIRDLLEEDAICLKDLEGFSEDLQEYMIEYFKR